MKFIATVQPDGTEEIFLFPDTINHDCMAEALARIKNQTWGTWERISREPISAGFIVAGKCAGESESLKLKCRGEADTKLLNDQTP